MFCYTGRKSKKLENDKSDHAVVVDQTEHQPIANQNDISRKFRSIMGNETAGQNCPKYPESTKVCSKCSSVFSEKRFCLFSLKEKKGKKGKKSSQMQFKN